MNYYEIYLADSNYLLARGTAQECVKQMGWKNTDTLYHIFSQTKKGKRKKYRITMKKGGEVEDLHYQNEDKTYE